MNNRDAVAQRINAKAALWAAAIASAVFIVLEMIVMPLLLGSSPWVPPRMVAAIGMGEGVLQSAVTFDAVVMTVAIVIHLGLSVLFAFMVAFITRGRDVYMAGALGAAFGLTKYVISFYGLTGIFPWFAEVRGWASLMTHVVYGAVLGWVYVSVMMVLAARKMRNVIEEVPTGSVEILYDPQ